MTDHRLWRMKRWILHWFGAVNQAEYDCLREYLTHELDRLRRELARQGRQLDYKSAEIDRQLKMNALAITKTDVELMEHKHV